MILSAPMANQSKGMITVSTNPATKFHGHGPRRLARVEAPSPVNQPNHFKLRQERHRVGRGGWLRVSFN